MGNSNGSYPNRLRHYRKMAGLTIRQLAKETGIGHGTVNQYELGRTDITLHRAIDLARALNVTVEDLITPEETVRLDDVLQIRVHHHKPGEKLPELSKEGATVVLFSLEDIYVVKGRETCLGESWWRTNGWDAETEDEFDWMVIPSDRKKAEAIVKRIQEMEV